MMLSIPRRRVRSLLDKLSTMTGSYPASTRATAVWAPMYPAPPVTRTFFLINARLFLIDREILSHRRSPFFHAECGSNQGRETPYAPLSTRSHHIFSTAKE